MAGDGDSTDQATPAAEDVVATAVEAAEGVIFSRYRTAEIRDMDVTVRYDRGILDVDVYLNVPDAEDADDVVDEAARAARRAVDQLLE